ncbi:MAG: type II toxin-antitoxin system PemK/MazF family toxin [Ignavibacteriales bacterium]|nr:type II toxin-antitoxin system PemK/MazF family toxin [Ignavibacteriales bacterium]
MPSTTHFEKWDIVLVPFPFTDLTTTKQRPALIISPNEYNQFDEVVIAFVTSQLHSPLRVGDYHIKHWQTAGLPKPSLIRMKFATLHNSVIIKRLGNLNEEDKIAFGKLLLDFFR